MGLNFPIVRKDCWGEGNIGKICDHMLALQGVHLLQFETAQYNWNFICEVIGLFIKMYQEKYSDGKFSMENV